MAWRGRAHACVLLFAGVRSLRHRTLRVCARTQVVRAACPSRPASPSSPSSPSPRPGEGGEAFPKPAGARTGVPGRARRWPEDGRARLVCAESGPLRHVGRHGRKARGLRPSPAPLARSRSGLAAATTLPSSALAAHAAECAALARVARTCWLPDSGAWTRCVACALPSSFLVSQRSSGAAGRRGNLEKH
ncbi:hypothetical protein AcV5_001989 [Taiwanofungus camphoratus]|nr:hypothetical protein AcV5_001989 [Antrodia cinnamomea]